MTVQVVGDHIYLLVGSSGDYEDHYEYTVAAYLSEHKAEFDKAQITAAVKELKKRWRAVTNWYDAEYAKLPVIRPHMIDPNAHKLLWDEREARTAPIWDGLDLSVGTFIDWSATEYIEENNCSYRVDKVEIRYSLQ